MFSSELRDFVQQHLHDDLRELALQASRYEHIDVRSALIQIESRQLIRDKVPAFYANPNLYFPERIAIEQCSSHHTASYKQQLLRGDSLIDLTGGLGVDSYYFALKTKRSFYIEQNPLFHLAAQHNFAVLGLSHVETICDHAQHFLESSPWVDTIYIDPARRDKHNRRLFSLEDTQPNVLELLPILATRCNRLIIKASTMADISQTIGALPYLSEVHSVAVRNECKELLFVCDFDRSCESPTIVSVNMDSEGAYEPFVFRPSEESNAIVEYTSDPTGYLYEPNVSLLKAGAFRLLSARFGVRKLSANSHLYVSDLPIASFPGRQFRIKEVHPFSSSNNKRFFSHLGQANLTIRNFPLSVSELRKRWNLREGGDLYLFATTCANQERIVIVTERCSE